MKIEYAARTEIGKREANEDRVLINGKIINNSYIAGEITLPAIAVICDGCGGYDGGDIAAETVLELLSYENPSDLKDVKYLEKVLENCVQAVNEKKEEMPEYSKMCTTIAGCIFLSDSIILFHSGDSRVYRYDKWGLVKMTLDHSAVQQLIDIGQITEEEALKHPDRNVITRCIGALCPPPEIYVVNNPISSGEKYLICSDGLWESVPAKQIKDILSSEMSLSQMTDSLINSAINLGSDDNISICICKMI